MFSNPVRDRNILAWQKWCAKLRTWLLARRGRQSRLANALGVRRQNVHRWWNKCHTQIPAWAAVNANVWFSQQIDRQVVSPQADKVVPPDPDKPETVERRAA